MGTELNFLIEIKNIPRLNNRREKRKEENGRPYSQRQLSYNFKEAQLCLVT